MRDCTKKLKMAHELTRLAVMLSVNDNKAHEQAVLASNKAWIEFLEHYNPWLDN